MLNKHAASAPQPPVSSERDDKTREALTELLESIGWKPTADAQHSRITAALPKLRALLAPSMLPAGGNAYPVDTQRAHAIAQAATMHLPKGDPQTELAYILASAQAMAGKTLLDDFAGQALQGLCANPGGPFQANDRSGWGIVNCTFDQVAEQAYVLGAAMLKAREQYL